MVKHEVGECLQRAINDSDAFGQGLPCLLHGRQLCGSDIVASHVHAYQRTGGANQWYEECAIQCAAACLASSGGRPNALGVGLCSDNSQRQRQASSYVFQWSARYHIAIAVVYALNIGDAVEVSHHRVVVKGVDAGLDCFNGKDLTSFANGGNPNGFKLGGKGTVHNTELYRCLAVGHRSKGFDQNNNAGTMKITNCTAYQNKLNYGFGNDYAYTLDIHNCISFEPGDGEKGHLVTAKKGLVSQSHNSWDDHFSVSAADFESLDVENLILSPRNADGTLAETLLLHLKSTSALIDKGMVYDASRFEGELIGQYISYQGSAPDLGCYEYGATPSAIEAMTFDDIKLLNPDAPCYNLQGRRVDASFKGIIIQSGRKFLSK